jgi:hypothetical protein
MSIFRAVIPQVFPNILPFRAVIPLGDQRSDVAEDAEGAIALRTIN